MRYLIALLLLFPASAIALTGDAARFDFTNGQPAITADNTTECGLQATARFDFTNGQPAIVFDSTADCVDDGPEPPDPSDDKLIVNNGTLRIDNGAMKVQ